MIPAESVNSYAIYDPIPDFEREEAIEKRNKLLCHLIQQLPLETQQERVTRWMNMGTLDEAGKCEGITKERVRQSVATSAAWINKCGLSDELFDLWNQSVAEPKTLKKRQYNRVVDERGSDHYLVRCKEDADIVFDNWEEFE